VGLRDADVDRLRAAIGEDTFDRRFELVREAGRGGMGRVFEAIDRESGARVAVKLLARLADGARFAAEAEVLERLAHPAIVRYVRHGTTGDGEPYLAMEWLVGEPLAQRLARGPLGVADACTVGERIAAALEHAHAAGVVHRDVKPSNVILVGGAVGDARLIDFGVAKTERDLTATGQLVGTPGYMAPEQVRGERGIDGRVDLFALGCVIYEAVAARAPFPGAEVMEVLARLLLDEPRPLGELAEGVPPRLTALVAALLTKDAARRLGDARVVREELAAIRAALERGDEAALAASSPAVPALAATAAGPAAPAVGTATTAGTRDGGPEAPPSAHEAPGSRRSRRSRRWSAGRVAAVAVAAVAVATAVIALAVYAWPADRAAAPPGAALAADRCTEYVRDGCEAACDAGSAGACYRLGQGRYTGTGGFTIDRPAALAAYARGCELGSMEACTKGATSLLRGDGGAPGADAVARAEQMLVRACERNAGQACRHLGLEHAPGGAFVTDPAVALRALARACDANDVPACRAMRTQLDAGRGDAASRAAAEASYAGACGRKLRLDCR
jgi:Protein kinase domain